MVLARPRRPLGPRQLGLQPRGAVAGQPRLRGAAGQLPGLHRLRQEVPARGQQAVGPQDARRPDRRRSHWAVQQGSPTQEGRDLRRLVRGLRDARGARLHARGLRLRGRHRRPSNLRTLVDSIPPYWKPMRARSSTSAWATWTIRRTPQLIKDASPLFRADKIVRPLLIGQGANDPRVKQAESEQIVEAIEEEQRQGDLRSLSRRGPRLRPAREPDRLQRARARRSSPTASAAGASRSEATTTRGPPRW